MGNGFTFSYLYLDKYRTIEDTEISFDHRYRRGEGPELVDNGSFEGSEMLAGPFFYGDKIYSMSCIVGQNGEGKTSLIDFLRESFLLMLEDINQIGDREDRDFHRIEVNPETNSVELTDAQKAYYHMGEETRFVIVFTVEEQDYMLSNIPNIRIPDSIMTYSPDFREKVNPEHCRIAYFSMMRFRSGVVEAERQLGRERDLRLIEERFFKGEQDPYRGTMQRIEPYKIEFSEEKIDHNRYAQSGEFVNQPFNYDVLFQLVFLFLQDKTVREWLGDDFRDRLQINSIDLGFNNIKLRDLIETDEPSGIDSDRLIIVFRDTAAYLRPFSSGQYSRFALLARLYWFLEGSERFHDTPFFDLLFSNQEDFQHFQADYIGQNMNVYSSAVILFDEGDLFYHPEWQRKFVGDIREMVKTCSRANMQIVFTTNSPFMMSDMLREDIITLTRERERLDESVLTFGQNIHTLLAHRFFLDSTIGSVSEGMIGWLIRLLDDPGEELDMLKKEETVDRTGVSDKAKWVAECIQVDNLPSSKAEACYVNAEIYNQFRDYCVNRGWDITTDKNSFLKQLISSIGEEIYRRRLLYRYERYRGRTFELKSALTSEEKEKLIGILSESVRNAEDPDVEHIVSRLREIMR